MTHLHQDAADLFGVQFLPSRWIDRIRKQPSMQKERRIRTTAAAAAENLWQLWAEKDDKNVVEKSE